MQTFPIRRPVAAFLCVLVLGACSRAENPYERIVNGPVVQGSQPPVSVTLVSADAAVGAQLQGWGYQATNFAANYPGTVRAHALMWAAPEPVVEKAQEFTAPSGRPMHVRLLVMPPPAESPAVPDQVLRTFYENVLAIGVPHFPAVGELPVGVRVHSWTIAIPDVQEANRRLREHGIPVIFSPVALTSPMFGDHKVLAIRAPDGVLVELIEKSAS